MEFINKNKKILVSLVGALVIGALLYFFYFRSPSCEKPQDLLVEVLSYDCKKLIFSSPAGQMLLCHKLYGSPVCQIDEADVTRANLIMQDMVSQCANDVLNDHKLCPIGKE